MIWIILALVGWLAIGAVSSWYLFTEISDVDDDNIGFVIMFSTFGLFTLALAAMIWESNRLEKEKKVYFKKRVRK